MSKQSDDYVRQVGETSNITPLNFLRAVYCNEGLPLTVRMKAAIEAAPYVHPKLSATAHVETRDVAALLDARLRQIDERKLKLIEDAPRPYTSAQPSSKTFGR